jgi:hypothetical protein
MKRRPVVIPPLDPQSIVGKTIKSIDTKSGMIWRIVFTDGTKVEVDTERVGTNLFEPILFPDRD